MDKAEAIKILKDFHDESAIFSVRTALETLHPELAESEDEKVRKTLIRVLNENVGNGIEKYGAKLEDALAWLEKQGKVCHSIMWHNILEEPEEMQELLCEWESDDATWHDVAFYHTDTKTFWNGERQVENVTKWCYINELLEKQGQPCMQYGITINGVEYEMVEDQEDDECARCALKEQCHQLPDVLCTPIFGSDIVAYHRFKKR